MPRALARHERIIADAAAARDGAVLKQKGEGDSTFAVFARVSDATAAALACQRALQCEDWPNGITLYLVALTSWRTAPNEALIALEECIAPDRISSSMRGRALALAAQLRATKADAEAVTALRQAITESHRLAIALALRQRSTAASKCSCTSDITSWQRSSAALFTEGVFANTYGVPAHELPDRLRALEQPQKELGAERYAAAIARGAAMSYDEALDSTTSALDSWIRG